MKIFILTFVTFAALIFGLNTVEDVSGLDTFLEVSALTRKQSPEDLVVWKHLFDQRAWLKTRIEESAACPEIFVLGSSTVGGFSADLVPNRSFLNGWLTGPSLEDYEAVTTVFERKGCFPRTLLISADPWLFNSKVNDDRWRSWSADYLAYRKLPEFPFRKILEIEKAWSIFKERFNFTTTQESVRTLFIKSKQSIDASRPALARVSPEKFCASISTEYYIRSFDGHFTSCPKFYGDEDHVRGVAINYLASNTHSMAEWTEVDRGREKRLTKLVERWAQGGASVVLLTPPYHPATYSALISSATVRENLRKLDSDLASLERKGQVTFLPLRDPAGLGCTAAEYSDSHHFRRPCFTKLANRLISTLPNQFGPNRESSQ